MKQQTNNTRAEFEHWLNTLRELNPTQEQALERELTPTQEPQRREQKRNLGILRDALRKADINN